MIHFFTPSKKFAHLLYTLVSSPTQDAGSVLGISSHVKMARRHPGGEENCILSSWGNLHPKLYLLGCPAGT